MTADYYRDIAALRRLIAENQGQAHATLIDEIIRDSDGVKQRVADRLADLDAAVGDFCAHWKRGGPGAFLLGPALDALDKSNLPADMVKILSDLRNSIRLAGGGGGGNAAWPSNYVSSSS